MSEETLMSTTESAPDELVSQDPSDTGPPHSPLMTAPDAVSHSMVPSAAESHSMIPTPAVGPDGIPTSIAAAPPSPTSRPSSGRSHTASGAPCPNSSGGGRSSRIGDHPRINAISNRAADSVTAPPVNAKILIFGDSQTGNSSGMGASIKTELVRMGYTASNINVSMNCGKTTTWLLRRLNQNQLNENSQGCGHYWDGPSSSIDFSGYYDFAFIISGGNDSSGPGQWNTHLASTRRLVRKFQNKLVWIGLAPSTGDYLNGHREPIEEIYRTREGQWPGNMSNPDPSGAELREVYNILLKEKLNPLSGVRYIDLRDVAETLTGVKDQLKTSEGHRFNTRWPDMGDGLHIHRGNPARAQRIGFWIANQIGEPGPAQTSASANMTSPTGAEVEAPSPPPPVEELMSVEPGAGG